MYPVLDERVTTKKIAKVDVEYTQIEKLKVANGMRIRFEDSPGVLYLGVISDCCD